ncbi:MAG: hypothetical protein NT129_01980, partial [Candidatus Aenigmarchaeota archaeon]|nr:hypothetical protein [Candidatus Aenigmarchaeota archaeon]
IVKSGNIPGIIGSEILRYSKRPTKNAIYTYERLLNYIPGLNKEDYNVWIIKMRNEQRFGYHITEIKTEGICLRLPAAQRFYADMTMNQSPL